MTHTLSAARKALTAHSLDACVITHTADLRWLTGWEYVFDQSKAHVALITHDKALIHTDSRYSGVMRKRNSKAQWQINDEQCAHSTCIAAELGAYAARSGVAELRVAIESTMPLNQYRALVKAVTEVSSVEALEPPLPSLTVELIEKESLILGMRAVKTAQEIVFIRTAQEIADAAFTKLLAWLEPGMSEIEIAAQLDHLMIIGGADGSAFQTIVASGPHSANPHAVPTRRSLQQGDFVVFDFGARYRDYHSDVTRTLCIGAPNPEQHRIYNAVLAAQTRAKAVICEGIAAQLAHEAALDVLKEYGYADYFAHALGHGIGLRIHELPRLAPKHETLLAAGNVVTVEPGVYIPSTGGVRIEDCGLVTAGGFESFTALSHELIVL